MVPTNAMGRIARPRRLHFVLVLALDGPQRRRACDVPPNRAAIRGTAGPLGGRRGRRIAAATVWPRSGRLLVVLGHPGTHEPRLTVGQTGKNASPLLGRDVANLAPDAAAVLDAHSAIFPLESLNQLKPGTYAVQALLHTNPDLNFPNAPGDLYSPVTTVRIDPAQAGTVRLELSQAVPQETLPADSELVKYRQDSLKTAQRFPRPADRPSRRRDPAARLRAAAGPALPCESPHRRLRHPVHQRRSDDDPRLGVRAYLDGRRYAAE